MTTLIISNNEIEIKKKLILKYKNIIKMSQDLMVFILGIIYPKERMGLI